MESESESMIVGGAIQIDTSYMEPESESMIAGGAIQTGKKIENVSTNVEQRLAGME